MNKELRYTVAEIKRNGKPTTMVSTLVRVNGTQRGILNEACHFHGVIPQQGPLDGTRTLLVTVGKEKTGFTRDPGVLQRVNDINEARVEMAKSRIAKAMEQSGVSPYHEPVQ